MNSNAHGPWAAENGGVSTLPSWEALRSRMVSGSLILLAGSGLVSLINLAYNVAIARLLGPAGFANAAAVYTLLMLLSAITLSFQIVCAKLVANHATPGEKAGVYAGLHHRAWRYGIVIGLTLILAREPASAYLNLPGTHLIVLLGLGTAFYIPLGARRGLMQGTYAFGRLAANFILEGLVRLAGAYLLVKLGAGVTGAVLASVAGVILAYFFAPPPGDIKLAEVVKVPASFGEGLQAIVFFVGQVVINNSDIVLVKHFFLPAEAGLYAAVALVGRVVNVCAWSVASSMFPVAAGAPSRHSNRGPMLAISLGLVLLILAALILGLWLMPSFLWRVVFGSRFELFGQETISSLLILYAVTSGVYALSSVIIAYEMSHKVANTGWVQLIFSASLVAGICIFHGNLQQVILVQLALLLALLVAVLLPFLRVGARRARLYGTAAAYGKIRKRRSLATDEVIAEFLKNEFPNVQFNDYRDHFGPLVSRPALDNDQENALRRSLLFLTQGALWRELPADTCWFEAEIRRSDLARIRAFPRAQWRRIAQGSFHLTDIVERIRGQWDDHPEDDFFRKLRLLSTLIPEGKVSPTILLIGINERSPLTVLDGNHRLTAAMLTAPSAVHRRFRFICGFSPAMVHCCWYQTNVLSLWRYAKNLVRYMPHNPESDLGRFLESRPQDASQG